MSKLNRQHSHGVDDGPLEMNMDSVNVLLEPAVIAAIVTFVGGWLTRRKIAKMMRELRRSRLG